MTHTLTWSALLARWTEFAASAVALPETGEPGRWKRAVPHIIELQALTHALGHISDVAFEEIPGAIDRASVGVRQAIASLIDIWQGDALAPEAFELCEDAQLALALAESLGFEWVVDREDLVCDHPGEIIEALEQSDLVEDMLLPAPGVQVLATSPAAHLRPTRWSFEEIAGAIDLISGFLALGGEVLEPELSAQRQVYRQFDFGKGGPVRDLVAPTALGVAPGQPLLVQAIAKGQGCSVSLGPRHAGEVGAIPVVFAESREDL